MNDGRKRLAEIATRSDEAIDLAEAGLCIAREEYPDLDIDAYLHQLDELGIAAREHIQPNLPTAEQVSRFNHFLFVDKGFSGNSDDYYDPRNSFLNDVIDRRKGIPISLSVVYCELAKRIGLPMRGVSFPGHFLVRHIGEPEIIVDPFFGRVITRKECAQRLSNLYGERARLERRMFEPARPRDILVRMLGNLKQIYVERSEFERALACSDRILLLNPEAPLEMRDRGILYQRLECFGAAVRDLQRFLDLAPDDPTAQTIRAAMPELYRQAAQTH
ncbi:MAG TPA: SirB1 family protein [Terriglobales bacterium]|nr:SirB1 family protein [Terriglobales bacterium]